MKSTITRLAIFFGTLCLAACSGELAERPSLRGGNQGVATFSIDLAQSRAAALDADAACDIRIYKYNADHARELIRHYFSIADMPESLWLLAGEYHISVAVNGETQANFDEPTYFGESDFTIAAGSSSAVNVVCHIRNTMIEVVYDASVAETFDIDYRTIVAVAEAFDNNTLATVDHLEYTATRNGRGYFTLPAGSSRITYCFLGHSSTSSVGNGGELHTPHATKEIPADQREGYLYRLTFRYSPDQGGYLSMDFEVDVDFSTDDKEDSVVINPSPKPEIAGDGFDLDSPQVFNGEEAISYTITPLSSEIRTVAIAVDATRAAGSTFEVDCTEAGDKGNGITVAIDDQKAVTLSLGAAFFNALTGGEHTLTFTATTLSNAEATARSKVRCSGAFAMVQNCWYHRAELNAYVYTEPASEVKIQYRVQHTEGWTTLAAEPAGENLYTAVMTDLLIATPYEFQLVMAGEPVGQACTETSCSAPQIPNAGFETWTQPASPMLPYDDTMQFWDTGNHGATTLGPTYNITTNAKDARPESEGTTSARMASRNVVVKFAAGNIFVGQYVATNGTNGVIGFGKPFDYTFRPKQIKFWYKGTVGDIDKGSGAPGVSQGQPDVAQFYAMLCKMDGPHIVNSADKSTFMNLESHTIPYCSSLDGKNSKNDQTGEVIAIASWENTVSQETWKEITLNFTYNEEFEDEVPTYLIVTASASKYGDYFMGSTSSVMYLDDIELVY